MHSGCRFKVQEWSSNCIWVLRKSPIVKKFFNQGTVEQLRSAGGGEYANTEVTGACKTSTDTPQQITFDKRVNRTFCDLIRVLSEQSGLGRKYWEYAQDHVSYVKNRLPHSFLKHSPFEALTGKKSSSNLFRAKVVKVMMNITRRQIHLQAYVRTFLPYQVAILKQDSKNQIVQSAELRINHQN